MTKVSISSFEMLDRYGMDAFNTLYANLSFLRGSANKIMVTSCNPHDGKSYVSMNLAKTIAAMKQSVLIIDADMRVSGLSYHYLKKTSPHDYLGLTDYLIGRTEIEDIVLETDIPGINIVLGGEMVVNSLALLYSPRMKALFKKLEGIYDFIIIDTPPLGIISDAARIAVQCEGVILVVQSGVTKRNDLKNAISQIERAGSKVIGVVLNKYKEPGLNNSYYSKKSYYYTQKSVFRRKK